MLDVSVDEVNVALQRLIRLDLLDMASTDRWVDKSGDACVSIETLAPEAVDAMSGQHRRLAAAAARHVPMTLREHSTITFAINSAALPRAFELVSRFRQQLVELLREGAADDVYQLDIALFPVTTIKHARKDTTWDAR